MKLNFVCFSEYLWPPKDPCGKRRRSGAFFFSKKKTTEEVKRRMFYRFSEINFFRKLLPEKVSRWLLLPLKKGCFLPLIRQSLCSKYRPLSAPRHSYGLSFYKEH